MNNIFPFKVVPGHINISKLDLGQVSWIDWIYE